MRSLRVLIDIPLPLPDEGGLDAEAAVDELTGATKGRFNQLRNAITNSRPDGRNLGPSEPVKATMHVCVHQPSGAVSACGPAVELQ